MERKRIDFSRSNLRVVLKYAAYVFMMFLMTMAQTANGIRPFGLGLFVALIFARQNLPVLAITYIAACIHADPSWQSAVIGAAPAVVFTAAYFIHHRLNKRLGITAAGIYTLVSQIPYVVFEVMRGNYYEAVLTAVLTEIFAYVSLLALYALIRRGGKYRPTTDESVALLVFAGAVALSLFDVGYQSFRLFYLFYGFALVASVCVPGAVVSAYVGIVCGMACAAAGGGTEALAVCVLLGAAAAAFKNVGSYGVAAVICATQLLASYYFGGFANYGYINSVALAVGAAVALAVPKKYKAAAVSPFSGASYAMAGKTVVNKNRREMSVRLFSLSGVFEDMKALLQGDYGVLPDSVPDSEKIAKDVALNFCGTCENRDTCFNALGGDTSQVVEDIVVAAEKKGRASIIDLPPFLTSRCRKINGLIQTVNDNNEKKKKCVDEAASVDRGRQMLAVQMGGVAEILDNLADDYKKTVSFDSRREKRIIDELTYHGVDCREVLVYGEGGDINVSALIGEKDVEKSVILTVISGVMHIRLIRTASFRADAGYVSVQFAPAPKYDFVYGEYGRKKEGSSYSGDVTCVKKLSPSKVLFAVSDGMGSGEEAQSAGMRAVQTVEGFYEAGFSSDCALALTNRLLSLKRGDGFSALDLTLVDLDTGACDFIKLGAPFSAVKRKDAVEFIEGSSLPVGAIDSVNPSVSRNILSNNDTVVLMSDGVTDCLTKTQLNDYLSACKGVNPQALCEDIAVAALNAGANDDVSVMAVRIFARG